MSTNSKPVVVLRMASVPETARFDQSISEMAREEIFLGAAGFFTSRAMSPSNSSRMYATLFRTATSHGLPSVT